MLRFKFTEINHDPAPVGVHPAQVVKAVSTVSKSSGNDMLKLTLRTLNGGHWLSYYLVFSGKEGADGVITQFCRYCEGELRFPEDPQEDFSLTAADCLHRVVFVDVVHESSPALIELGFVLDRSSSMDGLAATTVAAFNALLAEQRKLNTSAGRVSLTLFNDTCESVFNGLPLAAVSDLTTATYRPDGPTALWDGMGAMIEQIGMRFDAAVVSPRVLIITMTDGAENASRRYSLERIRQAIEYRQNACGWRFILISPGAAALAFKLGIPVTNTSRWETDPAKLRELLERVGRSISAYRLGDRQFALRLRG